MSPDSIRPTNTRSDLALIQLRELVTRRHIRVAEIAGPTRDRLATLLTGLRAMLTRPDVTPPIEGAVTRMSDAWSRDMLRDCTVRDIERVRRWLAAVGAQ